MIKSNNEYKNKNNSILLISGTNKNNKVVLDNKILSKLNYSDEYKSTIEEVSKFRRIRKPNKRILKQNKIENYDSFKIKPSARFRDMKLANPFCVQKTNKTVFGSAYINNGIPCHIKHDTSNLTLGWTKNFDDIDYNKVLPLCFLGIIETEYPYKFVARQACKELLLAKNAREKTIPLLKKLFISLRAAFNELEDEILINDACDITKILIELVKENANEYLHYILQALNKGSFKRVYKEKILSLLRVIEKECGIEAYFIIKNKIPAFDRSL